MWIVHNRALLRFVDARPAQSMVVSMSQVSQGFPLVDALNERWDMGLAPVPTNSLFDAGVTASRTAPIDVADEGLGKTADRLMASLENLKESQASLRTNP